MKNILLRLSALTAGICLAAQLSHAQISASATDFVTSASNANMLAIMTSNLALDKSRNRDILEFAERMVDRHTRAANWLKKAAAETKTSAALAKELDAEHQKVLTELILSDPGRDFDQRYARAQVDGHAQAMALLHNYSLIGEDNALRSFARRALPSLKRHHAHIAKVQSKEGIFVTQQEGH